MLAIHVLYCTCKRKRKEGGGGAKRQLSISLRWPVYLINSFDKSKNFVFFILFTLKCFSLIYGLNNFNIDVLDGTKIVQLLMLWNESISYLALSRIYNDSKWKESFNRIKNR